MLKDSWGGLAICISRCLSKVLFFTWWLALEKHGQMVNDYQFFMGGHQKHNPLYFLGTPIDLSSLVYDKSTVSRVLYGLLLVSSVVSVCLSFTAILKGGRRPIIKSYRSFLFLKLFLFILTKLMVQAYVLSIAMKSLMFYVANKDLLATGGDIFDLYFRGICREIYRYESTI